MPLVGELPAQRAPPLLLGSHQRRHPFADPLELLGRRAAVRRNLGDAGEHLPDQARDADHEEFVEIVGGDREEPQPLEQRMVRVRRFLQHAPVEFEPGQLAIDEPVRRGHAAAKEARVPPTASAASGSTCFIATPCATAISSFQTPAIVTEIASRRQGGSPDRTARPRARRGRPRRAPADRCGAPRSARGPRASPASSPGSTGTRAWATIGPASRSAVTKWTVQPCSARASASARSWV